MANGSVAVYKNGCERGAPRWRLAITEPLTVWRVPPWARGRFELYVGADFVMTDGRSGDVSGSLGMLVSRTRDRGLLPNRGRLACGAA